MQGSAMMYAIGPPPAGRISPLRVYAHSFSSGRGASLGTSCAQHFVQRVLVGYGHSSGRSPPHISSLSRSAGIHECDSGPALRAKHLPVLLSRRFEVIGFFFLAVDFFLRILLPLQLYGLCNRILTCSIQPFRKQRTRQSIQESRNDKGYLC